MMRIFFSPSPQKTFLAHYVTPPSFLAFRPPRSWKEIAAPDLENEECKNLLAEFDSKTNIHKVTAIILTDQSDQWIMQSALMLSAAYYSTRFQHSNIQHVSVSLLKLTRQVLILALQVLILALQVQNLTQHPTFSTSVFCV